MFTCAFAYITGLYSIRSLQRDLSFYSNMNALSVQHSTIKYRTDEGTQTQAVQFVDMLDSVCVCVCRRERELEIPIGSVHNCSPSFQKVAFRFPVPGNTCECVTVCFQFKPAAEPMKESYGEMNWNRKGVYASF